MLGVNYGREEPISGSDVRALLKWMKDALPSIAAAPHGDTVSGGRHEEPAAKVRRLWRSGVLKVPRADGTIAHRTMAGIVHS